MTERSLRALTGATNTRAHTSRNRGFKVKVERGSGKKNKSKWLKLRCKPATLTQVTYVHLICCKTHFLGSHVFFDVTWSCFMIRFCFKHTKLNHIKSTCFQISGAYCRPQPHNKVPKEVFPQDVHHLSQAFHPRARELSGPRPEERQFAHVQLATLVSEDPWSLVRIFGGMSMVWRVTSLITYKL